MDDGLEQPVGSTPPAEDRPAATGTDPSAPTGWRERVGERFSHRPVARFLLLNPLFALITLGLLLAVLIVGALLPKVWRTTPPGFRPVVRVSLLDLLQAKSLQRSARQQLQAGNLEAAARTIFSAANNNMGNPELIRKALETFIQAGLGPRSPLAQRASELAPWLLHLTRTNRNDLFLVARLYDALNDSVNVIRLLEPFSTNQLPPSLYAAMAKAMFDTGNAAAFVDWWRRLEPAQKQNPVLQLYHAAYLAGWGPPEEQAAHRARLDQAALQLDTRELANRLLLIVARQQHDLAGYKQALQRLESFRGDRVQDHVHYWLLLHQTGHTQQALQLARNYPYPTPASPRSSRLGPSPGAVGRPGSRP